MPHLAEATLARINEVMLADQGASFREALGRLMPLMDDAYRGKGDKYRRHLGASLIGRDCPRELWYGFRWTQVKQLDPRLLRLFNRGHLEEARFIAMLEIIGAELWYVTEDGGQFKFSHHNGHFGSALDCVVRGLPELPPTAVANAEFKTASGKMFAKVKKGGVEAEKPEHYIQMQICMHKMKLPFSLYMVVNKDNDDLYAEIITYKPEVAEQYIDRAGMIITAEEPPQMIHPSPGWFGCKFCDYIGICKKGEPVEKNCRTCAFSIAHIEDGKPAWECIKMCDAIENKETASEGCDAYAKIKGL